MSQSETQLRAPELPHGAGGKSGPGLVVLAAPRLHAVRLTAEKTVDPDASRAHAEVVREGDRFVLRDLGSTNGTFLEGRRVREGALCDGDLVRFGGTLALFSADAIGDYEGEPVPAESVYVGGPRARATWEGLRKVA